MLKLILRLAVVGVLVGGGVMIAQRQGVKLPTSLASFSKNTAEKTGSVQNAVSDTTKNVSEQTKVLGERAEEVSSHVENVLGSYVQENSAAEESETGTTGKTSIPEQTFEYGRYIYCQQVIKDYETTHPKD